MTQMKTKRNRVRTRTRTQTRKHKTHTIKGGYSNYDLEQAIKELRINTVKKIIKEDIHKLKYKDYYYGITPLHWVTESSQTNKSNRQKLYKICKYLITEYEKHLAKDGREQYMNFIDNKDDQGKTPLHYAVYMNHIEIVRLLLEQGANVNETTNNKYTPLHFAAELDTRIIKQKDVIEMCKLLLDYGANILAKTVPLDDDLVKKGSTPLELVPKNRADQPTQLIKDFLQAKENEFKDIAQSFKRARIDSDDDDDFDEGEDEDDLEEDEEEREPSKKKPKK